MSLLLRMQKRPTFILCSQLSKVPTCSHSTIKGNMSETEYATKPQPRWKSYLRKQMVTSLPLSMHPQPGQEKKKVWMLAANG